MVGSGAPPGLMPSLGIMLAFTGLMLLSGPSGASLNFQAGEIATLMSAIAIAAEIILISAYAGQVGRAQSDRSAIGNCFRACLRDDCTYP
jgi:hypothetical protein